MESHDAGERKPPKRVGPRRLPAGDDRLAGNVQSRRIAAGLTQTELAKKMCDMGHSSWRQTTVSRVEHGIQGVNFGELSSLQTILKASLWKGTSWEGGMNAIKNAAAEGIIRRLTAELRETREELAQSLERIDGVLDELRDAGD